MFRNKISIVLLAVIILSLLFWVFSTEKVADEKINKETPVVKDAEELDKTVNAVINTTTKNPSAELNIQKGQGSITTSMIQDERLIKEIEKEMQFSEAPPGDLSYMSPENETIQNLDADFPVMEQTDENVFLEHPSELINGKSEQLGRPFTETDESELLNNPGKVN